MKGQVNIQELVALVRTLPDCKVDPPKGFPVVEEGVQVPEDVRFFYELCGGMTLYESALYPVRIVSPDEVVPANPVIIGHEIIKEEKAKGTYDSEIPKDWYVIVDFGGSDYIVMDCHAQRLGRCYKAFWDSYAVMGETPIVAATFQDLLKRLIENKGQYWYFLEDDFVSLGDAYDDVDVG